MFCNQCEQTAKGTGCTVMGVCGKLAPVADLQDHVIHALRLLSRTALKARAKGIIDQDTDDFTVRALFATLTGKPVQAKPISTFPPVKQDLAFTVDETVTAGQLENVIRKAAGANLESIELFDVFTGEQVGEGKKSLAYAVVFRSPSKTLSAEDSDAIRKAIVAEAAEIGAQLRA